MFPIEDLDVRGTRRAATGIAGALAALLLGCGGSWLIATLAVERALLAGSPGWPWQQWAPVLCLWLLGIGLGARATSQGPLRRRLLVAAGAILAVVVAVVLHATLPAARFGCLAASIALGALPASGHGLLLGCLFGAGRHATRHALALSALGAAAAGVALPGWPAGMGFCAAYRIANAALLAAALVLPLTGIATRRERQPLAWSPDRPASSIVATDGLLAAWVLSSLAPPSAAVAAWSASLAIPSGLVTAAAALGLLLAGRPLALARWHRLGGVVVLLALPFVPGSGAVATGTAWLPGCAWSTAGIAVVAGWLVGLHLRFAAGSLRSLALGAAGGVLAALVLPAEHAAPALAIAVVVWRACQDTVRWLLLLLPLAAIVLLASRLGAAPDAASETVAMRQLAVRGETAVHYGRARQELMLAVGADVVDVVGPDRCHGELCATLLAELAPAGGPALVLGLGSGRLPAQLAVAGVQPIEVVVHRPGTLPLLPWLQGDGPVPLVPQPEYRLPAGTVAVHTGLRQAMASLRSGSRAAIVLGEPLHRGSAAMLSLQAQQQCRRVVGDGLVLLPFLLDQTPTPVLQAALGAMAAAHGWCGVFAQRNSAVLVGASAPPAWPAEATHAGLPLAARWQAHRCGIGAAADVAAACVGVVVGGVTASCRTDDDLGPLLQAAPSADAATANLALLHAAVASPRPAAFARLGLHGDASVALPAALAALHQERLAAPDSLAWFRAELDLRLDAAVAAILALPAGEGPQAQAAALATRWLLVGAPRPALQAALGLADRIGERVRAPAAAVQAAAALDPTFFQAAPPVLADLPAAAAGPGPLEDLAELPRAARLAQLASGKDPFAIALRARWPTAVAAALVAQLAMAPLDGAATSALRELADPAILREAALVLPVDRRVELLALWRLDLPFPAGLEALLAGPPAVRVALADACLGRVDRTSLGVLADLLVDADRSVRLAAGAALFRTLGRRIEYDPDWPASRLRVAAEQLRALHNRAP